MQFAAASSSPDRRRISQALPVKLRAAACSAAGTFGIFASRDSPLQEWWRRFARSYRRLAGELQSVAPHLDVIAEPMEEVRAAYWLYTWMEWSYCTRTLLHDAEQARELEEGLINLAAWAA